MTPSPDSVGASVAVLSGRPEAISEQLAQWPAAEIVVAALPETASEPGLAQAIQEGVQALVTLAPALVKNRQQARLRELVDALVPEVPPAKALLIQARMTAQARTAVLQESGPWLTGPQIARLAGFSESNPSAQPSRWKRSGAIFSLSHQGCDYFPAYALDEADGWRPRPAMADVLRAFGQAKDGWGLAYWFASVNGFLGGRRPQDVLATDPQAVVAAAQDELLGHAHG